MRRVLVAGVFVAIVCLVAAAYSAQTAPVAAVSVWKPGASWQYKVADIGTWIMETPYSGPDGSRRNVEEKLNELGREGWELCSTHSDLLIFKRPLLTTE